MSWEVEAVLCRRPNSQTEKFICELEAVKEITPTKVSSAKERIVLPVLFSSIQVDGRMDMHTDRQELNIFPKETMICQIIGSRLRCRE